VIEISCNLEGTKETLLSTEWRHDCHSVIHNLMDADAVLLRIFSSSSRVIVMIIHHDTIVLLYNIVLRCRRFINRVRTQYMIAMN
jgi:hypothetical protein